MKKTVGCLIIFMILIGMYTYRYLSLNQGVPEKVTIQQHLSGDSVEIEGNIVTVKTEVSDQPFREQDKLLGLIIKPSM